MNPFLQTGDVVEIQKGMSVSVSIPQKFVYSNKRGSSENVNHVIKIGTIFDNSVDVEEVKKQIIKGIQEKFDFRVGIQVKSEEAETFVSSILEKYKEERFDSSIFLGEYVVVHTELSGGGFGHGIHDEYPDGHEVRCKKMKDGLYDPNGIEITFYQSGFFLNKITPEQIQPIRKMIQTFL
ncbi:hypothetical protein ACFVS2_26550 [Brevibacillus sp. NPDC058079]|uniref:hypothetical protein n=1 Tax=Brevibacillus sp. NPDC058079 TaxID=3346330 RepID=UPI0036E81C12